MADIRAFHRQALQTAADIVSRVEVSDLGLATPCAEWTLGDLLAHMTVQNYGFAAAARGERTELSFWEPAPAGEDPVGEFQASASDILAAFAEEGVLDRDFYLPELSTEKTFEGKRAIGFQLIDNVAHGWDVAKALGAQAPFGTDLLAMALPLTLTVPGGATRDQQRSVFAREVPTGAGAHALDQIVAWLGRDPGWQPS
jgi:uncharacterized protein (TIGR03086 family)